MMLQNPQWYSQDYNQSLYTWQLMSDLLDSTNAEARIKFRNQWYLPMPAAFAMTGAVSPVNSNMDQGSNSLTNKYSEQINNQYNPNYHTNPLYAAYKTRGRLPSIADYTFRSLLAVINKREIILNLPKDLEYMRKDIFALYNKTVRRVIKDGTMWTVVDINKTTGKPCIKTYDACAVPKWKQDEYVILREDAKDPENPFDDNTWNDKEYDYKMLSMRHGEYVIVDKKDDTTTGLLQGEAIMTTPSYMGKTLDKMPVFCVGSTSLDFGVDQIPLLGIANIAIQIYQKNCDLANSQFLSCSPLLVFSGVNRDEQDSQSVGSGIAVYLPDAESKAYYTKTDTGALSHVSLDIDSLFAEAGKLGWALLGINKKSAESAAALSARTSANDATVQSITLNSATMIVEQLKTIAEWVGLSESEIAEISIDTNLAINSAVLSSADILALSSLWEKGALGWKTLFTNVKNSQMVNENISFEDELDDIINGHTYEKEEEEENKNEVGPDEDDKNSSNYQAPVGDDANEIN